MGKHIELMRRARKQRSSSARRIEDLLKGYPADSARLALLLNHAEAQSGGCGLPEAMVFRRLSSGTSRCDMELVNKTRFDVQNAPYREEMLLLAGRVRKAEILLSCLTDPELLLVNLFFLNGHVMPAAQALYAQLMPSEMSVSTLKSHKVALIRKLERITKGV